ncbi:hypothetical protein [Lonepinella sp. BR2882]|uniref:hypothetical protein n=1 Tax=Lonepinella sp. BR2882 TaxID=3095283 RepID=UPI003F6E0381
MSYFTTQNLNRISWRCPIDLESFFKKAVRGFYNENDEYVVNWYDWKLSLEKSITSVDVNFINITQPTYIRNDNEYQSFLVIRVPLNILHKLPFGSVWYKGKSKEKFELERFTVTFNKASKLSYEHLNGTQNPIFNYKEYIHASDYERFAKDANNLLVIKQDNLNYIVHPLSFFMAHYGYSSELKRLLSTYNWKKIEEKLHLNAIVPNIDKPVILPRSLLQNDAVFLYHLRYDPTTKHLVKSVSTNFVLAKEEKRYYTIYCWHEQDITLSFNGIRLGDTVLCCQIAGISQPQGEPINLVLPLIKRHSETSKSNSDETQYKTIVHQPEHQLEHLDIAHNPVNNLVTQDVIEYLETIGNTRQINRITTEPNKDVQGDYRTLHYDSPTDFGIGEKQGEAGLTGIANCFYDTSKTTLGRSRLETVWQHATALRSEMGAIVQWYTPKQGFNETDDFVLISLEEVNKALDKVYPPSVLVIKLKMNTQVFFVLSFPEKEKRTGFSSVVYEPPADFNDDKLIKILIELVQLGSIDSDYIDLFNGRMVTFIHRAGKGNNWVRNGIRKLM